MQVHVAHGSAVAAGTAHSSRPRRMFPAPVTHTQHHRFAVPGPWQQDRAWAACGPHKSCSKHRSRAAQLQAVNFEGAIPAGVKLEIKELQDGEEVEWDPDTKTMRLPISVVKGSGVRRTKLVVFTCNKCGGRTARNVNPVAWENGLVMGQCATCEVWHVLSAKNKDMYEEIRYSDHPEYDGLVAKPVEAESSEPQQDT
mmetsp:Transcript_2387/g.3999  ORF Transcript_2387/g.3999 Transcript_2387/m.3999 type:complete len:198 (-) Transcript_2387:311-904(-)|eukprot:CAMPEP_0119109188 /NCGR_PEP_ID=MMETSP1180-20130426/17614_1 /TAXON_ID=3052 ORGANISM="Chlamydomonas cf sp, Strain CCMP681" /NCGR_SAMPLE_ID=MMETSP1180 /ASSEMBLY_ACC=CAM_ASM_000741 /LENGTH=197 /DNA_ID=CAMNT_0007094915 /DNA_START=61 /DNA_END=654 /DNA_ORIENTATION=+